MRLQHVNDPAQHALAVPMRHSRPAALVEGNARGFDGLVDFRSAGLYHVIEFFTAARIVMFQAVGIVAHRQTLASDHARYGFGQRQRIAAGDFAYAGDLGHFVHL